MNRRDFLVGMGALSASMALDPERLLWVPGQKKIFIPEQPQEKIFILKQPQVQVYAFEDWMIFVNWPACWLKLAIERNIGLAHQLAVQREIE